MLIRARTPFKKVGVYLLLQIICNTNILYMLQFLQKQFNKFCSIYSNGSLLKKPKLHVEKFKLVFHL